VTRRARRRARTSRGSGSASTPNGRGGTRRRSRGSVRGGSCAARAQRLGREALAALRAAALQDRSAGPGRHPRAKAVLLLPPAYVWLIGPFHGSRRRGARAASLQPAASIVGPELTPVVHSPGEREKAWKPRTNTSLRASFPHLWRGVWRRVFSLQNMRFFRVGLGRNPHCCGVRGGAILALRSRCRGAT
jgi:hypothetical protein